MTEPAADKKPREYKVLAFDAEQPESIDDYGFYTGSSPEMATKRAEAEHMQLKAEGKVTVAIARSGWNPVEREVEQVERITYKPWSPKPLEAPDA